MCRQCIPRLKTTHELMTTWEKTNGIKKMKNVEVITFLNTCNYTILTTYIELMLILFQEPDPPVIHSKPLLPSQHASRGVSSFFYSNFLIFGCTFCFSSFFTFFFFFFSESQSFAFGNGSKGRYSSQRYDCPSYSRANTEIKTQGITPSILVPIVCSIT